MDLFGFNFEFNSKMDAFAGDKTLYEIEANELKDIWDSDLETVSIFDTDLWTIGLFIVRSSSFLLTGVI